MTHDHLHRPERTHDARSKLEAGAHPTQGQHTTPAPRAHAARAYFNANAAPPIQRQEKANPPNACEALSDEEKARRHALQTAAQKHGARVHNTPNAATGRCDATLTDANGVTVPINDTSADPAKAVHEAGQRHADRIKRPSVSVDDGEGMSLEEARARQEQIKSDLKGAGSLGGSAPWIIEGLRNDITGERKPYDDISRDAKMCEAGTNLTLNLLGGAAVKGNGSTNPSQRWVNPEGAAKAAHKKKRDEEDE